jgi:hypothetical protein
MREDPAIEIRRGLALIDHVAALVIEGRRVGGRCADNLVIGEHEGHALRFGQCGALHGGIGTVCPDNVARPHRAQFALAAIDQTADAIGIAHNAVKGAGDALGAGALGALAQPLVKGLAVDHADIAILDRHIDAEIRRRHHPCRGDTRHDQVGGNVEIADQARRHSPAAGLDAPGAVQQHHRAPSLGQIGCDGGS